MYFLHGVFPTKGIVMKAILSCLGIVLGLACPALLPAQCCDPRVPQAPNMCGPGFYTIDCYGTIYGPNYYVYPPFPPYNGAIPVKPCPVLGGKDVQGAGPPVDPRQMIGRYGPPNGAGPWGPPGPVPYRPGQWNINVYQKPGTPPVVGPNNVFNYGIPGVPGGYRPGMNTFNPYQMPGMPGGGGPDARFAFGYPGANVPGMPGFGYGYGGSGMMGPGNGYGGPGTGFRGPGNQFGGPWYDGYPGWPGWNGGRPGAGSHGERPGYGSPFGDKAPWMAENAPWLRERYGPGEAWPIDNYRPDRSSGPGIGFGVNIGNGPPGDADVYRGTPPWGDHFGGAGPYGRPNGPFGRGPGPLGGPLGGSGPYPGNGGGNGKGKGDPESYPAHPCARSPRDFFMME
jgi:hypothetical protein